MGSKAISNQIYLKSPKQAPASVNVWLWALNNSDRGIIGVVNVAGLGQLLRDKYNKRAGRTNNKAVSSDMLLNPDLMLF